ncbi:metalloregulator ArsR/SmtB family transcription factor [Methylibium sp.]|uniref:ArsR/SmtB family transcription factor n=1 Tax=Methylibium sp. TaxID=2067992 RepID=UPI00286BAB87|nr:metalloregulator ArsR/SmtB family transcription factor [Methylibium sp.]
MAGNADELNELNGLFEKVSGYFALLSEPTRLKILHSLCNTERSVGDIVEALGATQANVSRHLNLMHRAGVLARRKDGNLVFYSVCDPNAVSLCRAVCTNMMAMPDKPLKRASARRFMASVA